MKSIVLHKILDPLGRPTVTACSDNYFLTCRSSVPTFIKIVITNGRPVGLAEGIIDDICLVISQIPLKMNVQDLISSQQPIFCEVREKSSIIQAKNWKWNCFVFLFLSFLSSTAQTSSATWGIYCSWKKTTKTMLSVGVLLCCTTSTVQPF